MIIYIMEYYSTIKKNGLPNQVKDIGKFKCTLICEWSQPERATYYMIPIKWHSEKGKTMQTKRSVAARGLGERREMSTWSTVNF